MLTISPPGSRLLQLKPELLEIPPGSRNNPPVSLPFFTGSSPISLSGFSLRSKPAIPSRLTPTGDDPEAWLRRYFPEYFSDPMAEHHQAFWRWVWELTAGIRPEAFIGILPRGGGKSTGIESGLCALAVRGTRSYALYVSATQPQADDHVSNVGSMLESTEFAREYPSVASRRVGKYGASQGWRRNRLRTMSGFTVDAIGLEVAARGVKLEERRPDLLIFDDIDSESDSAEAVEKKIATLTRRIIPAGSRDAAILVIQNLQHLDSIVSQIADGRAKFLTNRRVCGPIPSIYNLTTEERNGRTVLTGGEPSWAGQDLAACQALVDDIGLQAFEAECQQNVSVLREQIFDLDCWSEGKNRYLHSAPLFYGEVFETWIMVDTAMKDGQEHDYTAFGVWQVLGTGRLRFREVRKQKLQFPDLVTATEDIAAEYYPSGLLRGVIIEDKVSGTSAAQTLRASSRYPWLRGLIGAKVFPGSKPERGRLASVWCARGMIELPHPDTDVPWLLDFERQLRDFPNIPHDDDVDVFIMGILYFKNYLALAWAKQLAGAGQVAA